MHSGVGQQRLEKASELPVGCHQESCSVADEHRFHSQTVSYDNRRTCSVLLCQVHASFSLSLKGKKKQPMFTFSDGSFYVMQQKYIISNGCLILILIRLCF